jgi:hypothetical protein
MRDEGEGGEGLGVWKCYSATSRIKPSDYRCSGCYKGATECYEVLQAVEFLILSAVGLLNIPFGLPHSKDIEDSELSQSFRKSSP